MQICILAEGLKIDFFALSDKKALCSKLFIHSSHPHDSDICDSRCFPTLIDQVSAISTHLFVTLLSHNVISNLSKKKAISISKTSSFNTELAMGTLSFEVARYLPIIYKFKYLIGTFPGLKYLLTLPNTQVN